MTAIFVRKPGSRPIPRKKYLVHGPSYPQVYADDLEEAKQCGKAIANRALLREGWNVSFITISILRVDTPGSSRYIHTGWRMYVPVRGTGAHYKDIVDRIQRRHEVAPMTWIKS